MVKEHFTGFFGSEVATMAIGNQGEMKVSSVDVELRCVDEVTRMCGCMAR